jgi:hypothetical protein
VAGARPVQQQPGPDGDADLVECLALRNSGTHRIDSGVPAGDNALPLPLGIVKRDAFGLPAGHHARAYRVNVTGLRVRHLSDPARNMRAIPWLRADLGEYRASVR